MSLYLDLVVVAFSAFALTLAYGSWRTGPGLRRPDRDDPSPPGNPRAQPGVASASRALS